jgi:hypothetical protein
MIGGILGFATSMVAWQATAIAVKEGAKWASSVARRSIVKYARYAESARNTRGVKTAKHIFDKVSKVEPRMGSRNLSEQTIRETTASYKNRITSASRRRILSNQTPGMKKAITAIGKSAADEISTLPATYIMYRLEKHGAVSPEERETTKSFTKWYFGAPMVFSMGVNAALRSSQKGIVKRTTMKMAKRYSRQTRSIVKTGLRALKSISSENKYNIADRAIAMSRSRRLTTESRGMISMLGNRSPASVYKHIKKRYKEELPRVKNLREHRFVAIERQLGAISNKMSEMKAGKPLDKMSKEELARNRSVTSDVIDDARKMAYEGYEREINKRSKVLNFVNEVLENAGSSDLKIRRKTVKGITKYNKKDMPLDPSLYVFKDQEFDMGNLSLSSIKDSLVKRAGRGVPQFALSLIGQGDMVQYLHSEHAMGTAFRIGRSGSRIYFPHSLVSDPLQRDAPSDVILSMMGMSASTATSRQRQTANEFLESRYNLYMRKGMSRTSAKDAFETSAARGEMWLSSDDILTHAPGGKMGIISKAPKDDKFMFINLGGTPGGKVLDYLQFSSQTNSIGSKLYRNWLGSERFEYFDKVAKVQSDIQLGPTPIERVKDQVEVEGTMGSLRKMLKKFEIGYSQEQSVFSKITGMFTKHVDPRYPGTLFSKDYLRNERWVDEMLKTDRSVEEFSKTIRNQAKESSDFFWLNMIRKSGGMNRMQPTFKKHSQNMPIQLNNYLVYNDQSIHQAKKSVDDLHDLLMDVTKDSETSGRLYSWLHDDLKDVKMMQRRFHDSDMPDAKLFDMLGDKFEDESIAISGRMRKPTVIDKYNATVFRITTALTQSYPERYGTFKFPDTIRGDSFRERVSSSLDQMFTGSVYNVNTQKEKAAYAASKKLGWLYQDISSMFAQIHPANSAVDRSKIVGSIKESVMHFVGARSTLRPDIDYVVDYHKSRKFKYSAASPHNFDNRPKVGQPDYDEIFMIPKSWSTGPISKRQVKIGPGQTIDIAEGIMDASNVAVMSMFHAFNRTASEFLGIGFDETITTTPLMYLKKMFTKRILPTMGIAMGYSIVNRAADEYLDGTPFGEGIGVFGANILAGARVAAQGMLDVTGGTDAAAYLEDLMPGSITSPISGLVRGVGPLVGGILTGAKYGPRSAIIGGGIGGAVSMLLGGGPLGLFGEWSIDKSRKHIVEELIGEREVPVRKARFWEMGGTDFHGGRIQYFRPHAYAMLRSDYEHAPGYKDSLLTEMVGNIAPDIYAMNNYYSRPYPATAGLFADIPVFSNMMHMLPGSDIVTGAGISMHQDELGLPTSNASTGYSMGQAANAGLGIDAIASMYRGRENMFGFANEGADISYSPDINSLLTPTPMDPGSSELAIGNAVANMQDIVGLRGFIASSIFGNITGRKDLFDYAPELASPVDIAGIRQSFWEMELGGLSGFCLTSDQFIITDGGNKRAEDITEPALFLGKGKYVNIKGITKRTLMDGEKIYTISRKGISLSTTGNHEVYIYKPSPCLYDKHRTCKPGKYSECINVFSPGWIPAEQVVVGDFVGTFIETGGVESIQIDFAEYNPGILTINDLPSFSYLCGQYIGNGIITGSTIEICHNHNNGESEEFYKRITSAVEKTINSPTHLNVGLKDSWDRTMFSHIGLSRWFKKEIGTSFSTKSLPAYIWTASLNSRLAMIAGIIDSGGCLPAHDNDPATISMKNESLMRDIQALLLISGISCALGSHGGKDKIPIIYITRPECAPLIPFTWKLRNLLPAPDECKNGSFRCDGMLWHAIEHIEVRAANPNEIVHDFILDDDFHGFIAGGIIAHNSEVLRRYIPHTRNQMQVHNPHRNTMPDWMPGHDYHIDFQHSDPFAIIPLGEARLAGPSYESLHNIDLSMPLEADVLGEELDSQMAYFLGFPEYMAHRNKLIDMVEPVKKDVELAARRYGNMVKGETHLYEPSINLHAEADAIVRDAKGMKSPVKIVPKGLGGESSLNAFMVLGDMYKGLLIEVDTETGNIAQRMVNRDVGRFQAEVENSRSATAASYGSIKSLESEGKAMNLANAYSWFDRFKILSDVAPYSDSYQMAEAIVDQQIASGNLGDRVSEYYILKDQRREKQKMADFNEYQFSSIGKSLTEYGKAKDQFHMDNYSYLERQVGSLWERASHMRSPVHGKLLHKASALEEYERSAIYSKGVKLWEKPIDDFLGSYYHLARADTDPLQGFTSWGVGGYLLGGGPLAMAMGVAGAGSSLWNNMVGDTYIPERVTQRREVMEQMDAVKYAKFKMLYDQTGDSEYMDKANRTMTSTSMQNQILSPVSTAWNIGGNDRYYIEDIINNVTTDNIEKVKDLLPDTAVASLYQSIGDEKAASATMQEFAEMQGERELPGVDSSIYSPNVPIETPLIETIGQLGLDAHDAGVGWYDQMAVLERSKQLGIYKEQDTLYPGHFQPKVTVKDFGASLTETGKLRSILLQFSENVSIIDDGQDRVELEIVNRG